MQGPTNPKSKGFSVHENIQTDPGATQLPTQLLPLFLRVGKAAGGDISTTHPI